MQSQTKRLISDLPVAIIGGGPVGLAAAAHLALRNQPFLLFESGKEVGTNVLTWGHVHVFSPWKYNIDIAAKALLETFGWTSPDPEALHTGQELYEYYLKPLTNHPMIRPFVHMESKVVAIGRKGLDRMTNKDRDNVPFVLQIEQGAERKAFEAKAVIDASGTWQSPNPASSAGMFSSAETKYPEHFFYGIPDVLHQDRDRFKSKHVLVIGGGHSAINSILELNQLKNEFPETVIHWILRKAHIQDIYGGGENDALVARGVLGTKIRELIEADRISVYTPFYVEDIEASEEKFTFIGYQNGEKKALYGIDEVVVNTGSRPDISLTRELRVEYSTAVESVPALTDLIDPNFHSCGTVRPHGELELRQKEKDYYVVGAKSYGRAPTFLMATGYEQVRSVVAALSGDWQAAQRIELNLPETGVCKSDGAVACC